LTCPFTPPDDRPAREPPPEERLPPEDLPAAPEARLDCVRLLLDAVRERGLALAPLALEPPRDDAVRAPERLAPLDEPRLFAESLFCPDFEGPWAILASFVGSSDPIAFVGSPV